MTELQPNLLYRAVNYGKGDYITLSFHRGRDGTLVAREDSGRIILLEDEGQAELNIQPRDIVDCLIVCIKGVKPDWTGNKRGGYSIVRPIKVKERAEERAVVMASLRPPLPESSKSEDEIVPETVEEIVEEQAGIADERAKND